MDSVFRMLRTHFWPIWCFLFLLLIPYQLLVEGKRLFEIPIEHSEVIVLLIYLLLFYPIIQSGLSQVVMHQYQQGSPQFSWRMIFSMAGKNLRRVWMTHILLVSLLLFWILLMCFIVVGVVGLFKVYDIREAFPHIMMQPDILWFIGLLSIWPVSYTWIRFSLALPMVTLESKSIREAYARSWQLTKRTYMILCIKWICLAFLLLPIILFWLFVDTLQLSKVFIICVHLVMSPMILAFGPIFLSLIYIDQRARKEAFDLEIALKEVIKDSSGYRTGKKATTRSSF